MYETTELAAKNIGTPNDFAIDGSPEASAMAVIAISGITQNELLLATRDFSHISYQTINFQNSAVPSGTFSYSLERTVVIGESVYTATLYLWRMSF